MQSESVSLIQCHLYVAAKQLNKYYSIPLGGEKQQQQKTTPNI